MIQLGLHIVFYSKCKIKSLLYNQYVQSDLLFIKMFKKFKTGAWNIWKASCNIDVYYEIRK